MAVQKAITILLVIVLVSCTAVGAAGGRGRRHLKGHLSNPILKPVTAAVPQLGAPVVYDIVKFGAKADGKTNNFQYIVKAWLAACRESAVPSKLLIPPGTFRAGQVVLAGPCKSHVTIEVQGTVLADPNGSNYFSPEWFLIEDITTGLLLTGSGTFDGQGKKVWRHTNCDIVRDSANCAPAPTNLKFDNVTNAVVNGITSLNPKMFHVALYGCNNFQASGLKLTAPADSPNTVGFDIAASRAVTISNTVVATGANCFNVAPDTVGFSQVGVNCVNKH